MIHIDILFTLTYYSDSQMIHILAYYSHIAYVTYSATWFTFCNMIHILTYNSHSDTWFTLTYDSHWHMIHIDTLFKLKNYSHWHIILILVNDAHSYIWFIFIHSHSYSDYVPILFLGIVFRDRDILTAIMSQYYF